MRCPSCEVETENATRCPGCGVDLWTCGFCGAANTGSAGGSGSTCVVCDEPNVGVRSARSIRRHVAADEYSSNDEYASSRRTSGVTAESHVAGTRPRSRHRPMEGIARGVTWRTETTFSASGQGQRSTTVLNFRIDRFDTDGRQLPGLAVEMRGNRFRGVVSDGDRIEIPAGWQPGRLQTPRRLRNLTSGTVVRASHSRIGSIVGAFLAIIFILIVGYLVIGWMGAQPDLGVPDMPSPEGFGDWEGWDGSGGGS